MSYWAFLTALKDHDLDKAIQDGKVFSASKRFEDTAAGSTTKILFQNPADSGVKARILLTEIITQALFYIDIYRDVTVESNGTEIPSVNLNFASTNIAKCKVEYGGTYSGGDLALSSMVPGGNVGKMIGDIAEFGESALMPPNRNMMISVTNASGGTASFSVRFLWVEV